MPAAAVIATNPALHRDNSHLFEGGLVPPLPGCSQKVVRKSGNTLFGDPVLVTTRCYPRGTAPARGRNAALGGTDASLHHRAHGRLRSGHCDGCSRTRD